MVFRNAKSGSQFSLPKSGKSLPPKKVNAVLDVQSDAAVGLPPKTAVPGKKSGKGKAMKDY